MSAEHEAQELLSRICAALGLHEWDHVVIDTLADDVWVWQVRPDGHEMRLHCLPGVIRDWETKQDEVLETLRQLAEKPSRDGLETILVRIVE